MSDVLEDVREDTTIKIDTSDGDHDVFSHYVKKADILAAHVDGIPAKALCGKVWVPHRDEQKYPVCPDCKKIYEGLEAD